MPLPLSIFDFKKLAKVPFIIWIVLLQAFLLVTISKIAPVGEVDAYRNVLMIYILLELMIYSFIKKVPGFNMNTSQASIWFVGAFVGSAILFTAIKDVAGYAQSLAPTYAIGSADYLIILHTSVVAIAETAFIFQGGLVELIGAGPAQIAFGVFHYAAYSGNIQSILVAIIAGFIFYGIVRLTGNVWAAAGIHAGWNVALLGILSTVLR